MEVILFLLIAFMFVGLIYCTNRLATAKLLIQELRNLTANQSDLIETAQGRHYRELANPRRYTESDLAEFLEESNAQAIFYRNRYLRAIGDMPADTKLNEFVKPDKRRRRIKVGQ